MHGTNDRLVPVKNSLLFYEASINAGVPAEMHILDNGPHGFGMGTSIDDETVREWPLQALRFMARHQMIPRSGEIAGLPAGEPDVLATLPGHIAVSERLHVSGQPSAEALAKLGSAGVHTVIDLRSDAETPDLDERAVVEKSGVAYRSLPVSGKQDLTRENVAKFDELLKQADSGKVLVHCSSGNRVGAMLALRARWVEGKSAAEALAVGKGAGLAGLEGEVKSLLDTDVVSGVVEMAPRVTY